MSDHINVRFPDKIKVTSPKIDAIERTAERISTWLHNDLKKIIEPLQSLNTLPRDIEDLKKRLVEQFRLLFARQVTLQMKVHETNIRVAERKAQLIEQHIKKKQKQITDAEDYITARFSRAAESISKGHAADLKRLDSHAYDITDTIYPEQIKATFSFASVPFWKALLKHSGESAKARSECLLAGYEAASSAIEHFLAERQHFYTDLAPWTTDLVEEGALALPYWFAMIEDTETGEHYTEIFFDEDLDREASLPLSEEYLKQLKSTALEQLDLNTQSTVETRHYDKTMSDLANLLKDKHQIPTEELKRFEQDRPTLYTAS